MAELKGWTSVGDKVFGTYGSGSTGDKTNFESKVLIVILSYGEKVLWHII